MVSTTAPAKMTGSMVGQGPSVPEWNTFGGSPFFLPKWMVYKILFEWMCSGYPHWNGHLLISNLKLTCACSWSGCQWRMGHFVGWTLGFDADDQFLLRSVCRVFDIGHVKCNDVPFVKTTKRKKTSENSEIWRVTMCNLRCCKVVPPVMIVGV